MKTGIARIEYAGNDFFVATTPSGHAQVIDIDGERSAATGPFELVQVALGGCTGADVISVLKKKRQDVTAYRVEVKAERRDEHPRSYKRIEVKHIVRGRGISEKAVEHAVQLSTEKYCGVINSLRPTAEIVATWEIQEEPAATPA
ncbi:MAG: OsmC family protein [Acidobacteriota bacterium]